MHCLCNHVVRVGCQHFAGAATGDGCSRVSAQPGAQGCLAVLARLRLHSINVHSLLVHFTIITETSLRFSLKFAIIHHATMYNVMQSFAYAVIDIISRCFLSFHVYIVAAVEHPQSGVATNCLQSMCTNVHTSAIEICVISVA